MITSHQQLGRHLRKGNKAKMYCFLYVQSSNNGHILATIYHDLGEV